LFLPLGFFGPVRPRVEPVCEVGKVEMVGMGNGELVEGSTTGSSSFLISFCVCFVSLFVVIVVVVAVVVAKRNHILLLSKFSSSR